MTLSSSTVHCGSAHLQINGRGLLLIRISSVMQKFNACIEDLRASGQGFLVPDDRPVHGVGHSNGALLHLLIGSMLAPPNASNALISFNNKYVCPFNLCCFSDPTAEQKPVNYCTLLYLLHDVSVVI